MSDHVWRVGDRFEHAHQITGSPKAGTAQPVVCRVTAVRRYAVYYRPDDEGTKGLWKAAPDKVPAGRVLTSTREGDSR